MVSKESSLFSDVEAYGCDTVRQNAVNLGRRRGRFKDGTLGPRELLGRLKICIISEGR